jgi:hypothetical protein
MTGTFSHDHRMNAVTADEGQGGGYGCFAGARNDADMHGITNTLGSGHIFLLKTSVVVHTERFSLIILYAYE